MAFTLTRLQRLHWLTVFIAMVWLVNGLFFKVFNLIPRHQLIVGRFFGDEISGVVTLTIGLLEVGMAMWILSGYSKQINALVQIFIILSMNILEFWLVPNLLLWGRFNLVFALGFLALVAYDGGLIRKLSTTK